MIWQYIHSTYFFSHLLASVEISFQRLSIIDVTHIWPLILCYSFWYCHHKIINFVKVWRHLWTTPQWKKTLTNVSIQLKLNEKIERLTMERDNLNIPVLKKQKSELEEKQVVTDAKAQSLMDEIRWGGVAINDVTELLCHTRHFKGGGQQSVTFFCFFNSDCKSTLKEQD